MEGCNQYYFTSVGGDRMAYVVIYLAAFIFIFIKVLDFKEAFQRTIGVGVFCIVAFVIINYCFSHMENFQKLFIDMEVYEITGVNSDTIVYLDENNNLAVISKDNVMVIKNDHTVKSWLTCMKLKKAGKALVIKEFPEDWEAYVVPRDELK